MATAVKPEPPPGFVIDTPAGLPAPPEGFALDAVAPPAPRPTPAEAEKRAGEEFNTAVEMGIPLGEAGGVVDRIERKEVREITPSEAEGEAKAKILALKYGVGKPKTPWSGLTSMAPPPEFEKNYKAYAKLPPSGFEIGKVAVEPERPWMPALMATMATSEGADRVFLVKELLTWESPGLYVPPNAKPGEKPFMHMGYIQPPDARVPRPLYQAEVEALTATIQGYPDAFTPREISVAYRMSQTTVRGTRGKDWRETYEGLYSSAFPARMRRELANRVPWYDRILNAAAAFQQGAVYTVASFPKAVAIAAKGLDDLTFQYYGADASTKDLITWKMGQALQDFAMKAWPTNPDLQGRFLEDALPRGAGSMLGFMAASVGGTVAAAKGLSWIPARAAPYATAALAGAAAEGTEGFEDALAMGASEDVAFQAFLLRIPGGTLEALPVGRMVGRLNAGLGGKLASTLLKEGATDAFENAVQEALQRGWGNAVARMTYDPERGLGEGVLEATAIGGITGFLASAAVTASTGQIPAGAKNLTVEQQMKLRAIRDSVAERAELKEAIAAPPAAPTPGSRDDLVARVRNMVDAGETVTPETVAANLAVSPAVAETLIGEVQPTPPAAAEVPAPPVPVEAAPIVSKEARDLLISMQGAAPSPTGARATFRDDRSNLYARKLYDDLIGAEKLEILELDPVTGSRLLRVKSAPEVPTLPPAAPAQAGAEKELARVTDEAAFHVADGLVRIDGYQEGSGGRPGHVAVTDLETGTTFAVPQGKTFVMAYTEALIRMTGKPPVAPAREVAPETKPGALPEGTEATPPETTSIKKAVMEAERVAREAEPLPEPTPQTRQQWLDEAKKRVETDPELPQRLVQKLREEPQALDQVEIAVLQNHRRGLKNAYQEATEKLFAAAETGDDAARAAAQVTVDAYSTRLDELDVAAQVAKTVWGRTGVSIQIELAQDYSLAGMVRRRQAAKGGKALTNTELAKIKSEHERLAKVESELAEREKAVAAREEAASAVRAKGRVEKLSLVAPKSTTLRPTSPRFGEANRVFTRAGHDAALASLKSRMGRLTVGVDIGAMADLTKIGGFYFEGGLRKFEVWAEEMAKGLGELATRARPYFADVWKQVHAARLKDMQETIAAKYNQAKAADKEPRGLAGDIQELFKIYTARGLARDEAVTAVHEFLETLEPGITRRETMDAISGYGKWRLLDKDALKAEVRMRKGELQELAKLEDMAEGRAPAKTGFERQSPSDARRELVKKVNDAKREGGYDIPDPETQLKSAVQSLRTRWKNEITDLTAKIEAGEFAKPAKREPIALDEETLALRFERDRIKKEFNEGNFKLRMAQRTVLQKIVGIGQEALNLPRAIKSSLDLSALLRQNLITTISHPIRTLKKTVPAAFRGLTKRGEHKIDLEITARKNFGNYVRDGLSLTEHGQSLAKMEEVFMSRYAEKIPLVAASQRAYTTTLNVSRADSYDVLAATIGKGRTLTPAEGKLVANFINIVTGRGGGGKYGSALTGLNSVFFAPRNLISRFEFLVGQPLWHGILSGKVPLRGTVGVRLQIAGEYARFLTGMGLIYALAAAAGMVIGYDPRKSTFGKIRVGKTWLDPLAGLSQMTVFLSRLITGEKVTVTGKKIALRGEKTVYGAGDMGDVMWDFTRSKFSPVVGAGVTVVGGKTYIGEPVTPASTAADLFMPMAPQDIYEAMKANGVPEATILSIMAFFGASLQTYDEKGRRANP